jgi:hypothetical protein
MIIQIDEQLLTFMKDIRMEAKTQSQWARIESCDWFQSDLYCGGYDADEAAFCFCFCFSYFYPAGREF